MLVKHLKFLWRHHLLRRSGFRRHPSFPLELLGGKHGWTMCVSGLNPDSVVYSFGVGVNIEWDLAMIERLGVEVHAFDPTPECIAWVAQQSLPPQFRFYPVGLAAFDGSLEFYPPKRPGRVHYTQDRQRYHRRHQTTVPGPVRRLRTLADELGHSRIDLLKMDIEGTEFDCVDDVLASGLEIDQLLVEVHYNFPSRSFAEGLALLRRIEAAGYVCFDISQRALEFGFIHERLSDRLTA
ncbi:MAG: FkbM family methyltransferase [Pirellulales bacterium]